MDIFLQMQLQNNINYKHNILYFKGWKCANTNSLNGTTNTCRRNNNMTSVFSFLFNFTIILPKAIDFLEGKWVLIYLYIYIYILSRVFY